MDDRIERLIERLAANNIPAIYVDDREQAVERILDMIPEESVVGFGDSVTVREIGLLDAIENSGHETLNPRATGITPEESLRLKKQALTSSVFVTGTNALTMDGKIVNVDGLGNRVAAMLFGPDLHPQIRSKHNVGIDCDEPAVELSHLAAQPGESESHLRELMAIARI
jgi:hypothetical protein